MGPEEMTGHIALYAVSLLVLVLTALLLPDLIAKLRKVELSKPADHPLFRNGGAIEAIIMLVMFPARLAEACSKAPPGEAEEQQQEKK